MGRVSSGAHADCPPSLSSYSHSWWISTLASPCLIQHGLIEFTDIVCIMAQMVKTLPVLQETQVRSLGQEDPLEKGMATAPVFLPEKSHGQRSLVCYSLWGRRVGHDWATNTVTFYLHLHSAFKFLRVSALHWLKFSLYKLRHSLCYSTTMKERQEGRKPTRPPGSLKQKESWNPVLDPLS